MYPATPKILIIPLPECVPPDKVNTKMSWDETDTQVVDTAYLCPETRFSLVMPGWVKEV